MKVLSRTGLGVALLLMGLFLFYAALLDARATGAQTGGGTTGGETTGGAQEDLCDENEELVGSVISGDEDVEETESFDITGSEFRVVVNAVSTAQADGEVNVDIFDEDGFFSDGVSVFVDPENFTDETGSSGIVDGPGTFTLGIDANGASYEIAICQTPGQEESTGGDTDEDTDNDGVIDDTIPDKDLPDTGGSTALVVGGSALLLLYGGLVAWRLKTRER